MVYTKEKKKARVTMEFKVPKRHIPSPTLSTEMVQFVLQWERQQRCYGTKRHGSMAEKCCNYDVLLNILWGKKDEDKRRQEHGQT